MSSAPIEKLQRHWHRLSIRWRLASVSAVLTFVILCTFAVMVGLLAGRQIRADFDDQVSHAADDLASRLRVEVSRDPRTVKCSGVDLADYARAERAVVKVSLPAGTRLCGPAKPDLGFPRNAPLEISGHRVESRLVPVTIDGRRAGFAVAQYARPLSDLRQTVDRVRFLLLFGVLGGTALALLAGLAVARRAMRPIARITSDARAIERTRDPGRRMAIPEHDDEIAELARTLDDMLQALDGARSETEDALTRQKAFVADASHELRTPLTSVLANLELLSAELAGEQRETADAALRSSRRMRRLVADLLLLARADAGHEAPHRAVDLSQSLVDAAGELGPVASQHAIAVEAPEPAWVDGAPDELHQLVLNLLQNAVSHTQPGSRVTAQVRAGDETHELVVEDDGPGVPAALRERIFDRFVRAQGDAGGGTGLGLAIVRAVAESHGGTVRVEAGADGDGARFVVDLPAARAAGATPRRRPAAPSAGA
jgi:two-component system OmpR family sensor kinase